MTNAQMKCPEAGLHSVRVAGHRRIRRRCMPIERIALQLNHDYQEAYTQVAENM
jgi:hypothetical protein